LYFDIRFFGQCSCFGLVTLIIITLIIIIIIIVIIVIIVITLFITIITTKCVAERSTRA
jgi:Flp pilus assembly protein TadB